MAALSAANQDSFAKRKSTINTSSNVGKTLVPDAASAAGIQGYNRAECYDSNLNPYTQEKGSKQWIQINQTEVDFNCKFREIVPQKAMQESHVTCIS
jgi:hypothetical protein